MQVNKSTLFALTTLMLACGSATVRAQDAATTVAAPQAPNAARQRQNANVVHLSDLSMDTLNQTFKLSDEQKTKIKAVMDKRAADYKTLVLPPTQQGDRTAVQEANGKRLEFANKADADIEAVLTDDQKKTLSDFKQNVGLYQRSGLPLGLMNDLKLTDEQKRKIGEQATENQRTMRQKTRAARQSGTAMTPEQRRTMMKENRDKILTLLTPEQRTQIEKYDKDHTPPADTPPAPAGAGTNKDAAAPNP